VALVLISTVITGLGDVTVAKPHSNFRLSPVLPYHPPRRPISSQDYAI